MTLAIELPKSCMFVVKLYFMLFLAAGVRELADVSILLFRHPGPEPPTLYYSHSLTSICFSTLCSMRSSPRRTTGMDYKSNFSKHTGLIKLVSMLSMFLKFVYLSLHRAAACQANGHWDHSSGYDDRGGLRHRGSGDSR